MRPLSTDGHPDWYFESYDLEWWVYNLFDTPVEIHTFQLGLLVGLLFGILAVQEYPKTLAISLVALLVFLGGAFEGTVLCTTRTETCAHIQLKPWYFLSGVALSKLGVLGMYYKLSDTSATSIHQRLGSQK